MKIIPCDIIIGIDPGRKTGFAPWFTKKREFGKLEKLTFYTAQDKILAFLEEGYKVGVVVEESGANKGVHGNKLGYAVQIAKESPNKLIAATRAAKYGATVGNGIGSNHREAELFIEWLDRNEIPYEAIRPTEHTSSKKMDHKQFCKKTGYTKQTNEHSRDAGMLAYGKNNIRIL